MGSCSTSCAWAARIDTLNDLDQLASDVPNIQPEDLRPYLGSWSPYGPDSRD